MKTDRFKIVSCLVFLSVFTACTEPFVITDTIDLDYDQLLVVEGTLTNEFKHQEIKLSRTRAIDSTGTLFEYHALVAVEDDEGEEYHFKQDPDTNVYLSIDPFAAAPGSTYRLRIKTQDGNEYISSEMISPKPVEIDAVYPELDDHEDFNGVTVYVDAHDENNEAKYFRYEYEETYKIKVPYPSNYNWEFTRYGIEDEGFYEVILTWAPPKTICYSPTFKSKGIMQFSTKNLDKSNVVHYPIRFIWELSPMLRERYSILVKQYIQSVEAYSYYKTLEDLEQEESLLSQSQTGYVKGNMRSITNPTEKVLGFFDVSPVTSKRIYFNYFDFGYEFPPYFFECERLHLLPTKELKAKIEEENYQIVDWTEDGPIKGYFIYKQTCTDCTSLGSQLKPDFWED